MERLSVAVVVNYCLNADGKAQPMSKEQLAQIEALVREAMGYSSSRGDSLQVVNTPFTDNQMTGGELPFWQSRVYRFAARTGTLSAGTAGRLGIVAQAD